MLPGESRAARGFGVVERHGSLWLPYWKPSKNLYHFGVRNCDGQHSCAAMWASIAGETGRLPNGEIDCTTTL